MEDESDEDEDYVPSEDWKKVGEQFYVTSTVWRTSVLHQNKKDLELISINFQNNVFVPTGDNGGFYVSG